MTEAPNGGGAVPAAPAAAAAPAPVQQPVQQQQPSGNGNNNPFTYIGCNISLISKSQIRYEGILYTIDTNESTVALRSVRSFGTEGRNRPEGAVPPRAEVYEFVIFRGADILDLTVVPPQQQPVQQQVYHDPAIVARSLPAQPPQHQHMNQQQQQSMPQMHPQKHPAQMVGPPIPQVVPNPKPAGGPRPQPATAAPSAAVASATPATSDASAPRSAPQNASPTPVPLRPLPQQQQSSSGQQGGAAAGQPQLGGLRPLPRTANGEHPGGLRPMTQGYNGGQRQAPRSANGVHPGGLRPLPQHDTPANNAGRVQPGGLRPPPPGAAQSSSGSKWGPPVHARNWGPPPGQPGHQNNNIRAPAPGSTVRRANGGYANRGRGGGRRQRRRGPGITVPSEDFDFESMHDKFDKVALGNDDAEPPVPVGMPAVAQPYDKNKGFFDSLVPEKQIPRERINAAQRRATDMETFGEVGNVHRHNRYRHNNNYRGRRGGRGRRMGHHDGHHSRGDHQVQQQQSQTQQD